MSWTRRGRRALVAAASIVCVAGTVHAQAAQDTLRIGVEQAVGLALRDGVEAAMARQDVVMGQAQEGVARSYALPEINATGTYTRNIKKPVIFFEFEPGQTQQFEIGQDNAWVGALTLRQVLWASGRVRDGYHSAQASARAAEQSGDDAAANVARDVRTAYYLALLAREQTRIARESLQQAERTVAQIAERVEKGVAPEFERLRASVTVASRRPDLTRARNGESIARASLKRLVGVPLDRPLVLTDTLERAPHAGTLEDLSAQALARRRDLAAAREAATAARLRSQAQAANDRPTLYLDGNLSWQGETSDGLWPGDRESASSAALGLSFAWPLLDGFRNRHQSRAAEAAAEKAQLQVTLIEDAVRLEVRSRIGDVESIAEEIDAAEETVSLARRAWEIAQTRYQTGLSTLIELQDAELAYIQARVGLSSTLYRYNVALADLDYTVGNGPTLDGNREDSEK